MNDNNILNTIMGELLKISSAIGTINQKLEIMDRKIDILSEKVERLEKSVEALEKRMDTLENRVDQLEETLKQLKVEMYALNRQVLDRIQSEMEDAAEAHIDFSKRLDNLYVMINK